jgi:hypothetical protein
MVTVGKPDVPSLGSGAVTDGRSRRTPSMDDIKQGFREGENKAKEAWRKADGEEDVSDKLGNLGDDIRQGLGNAGDTADREVDRADRDLNDDRYDTTKDRL